MPSRLSRRSWPRAADGRHGGIDRPDDPHQVRDISMDWPARLLDQRAGPKGTRYVVQYLAAPDDRHARRTARDWWSFRPRALARTRHQSRALRGPGTGWERGRTALDTSVPRPGCRSPDFGSGRVRINSAGAPRAGLLPPLLPMLRRASPLAQHRRARPTAAMTDQERHDWAQKPSSMTTRRVPDSTRATCGS
jgi:hypothetical protein